MTSEWIKFTDLLSAIVDNRGKTCPVGNSGLPLIATNCVTGTDLYPCYDTTRFVSEETYKTWFRGHPEPGDILFVCKGSPGRTSLVPNPVNFCIAQDMVAVRADAKKVYPRYLFAALRSQVVRTQIDNMHVGTMIPHFKKGDFDKLLIPMLEMKAQIAVGDLYFTISDRITRLRETNKTLEAIAQAIFKSWFVDFDPVRAKMEGRQPEGMDEATAALFPDSFEESELGLVPKGWKISSLAESCSYLKRGLSPKYLEKGGVLVLNQKCVRDFSIDFRKARRHDNSQRAIDGRTLEVGDVVVNSTGVGTLGRVAQVLDLPETTTADSHLTIVRAGSTMSPAYLGEWMQKNQTLIESMGEGTTGQTELSRAKLGELRLLAPPSAIQLEFSKIVQPLKSKNVVNSHTSASLEAIRDTLLPRLISGQLRLPKAQEQIENALT